MTTRTTHPSLSTLVPRLGLCAALAAVSACTEDLDFDDDTAADDEHDDAHDDDDDDEDDESGETDEPGDSGDERVEHEPLGGGVVRTTVDASDEAETVYLDLDTQLGMASPDAGWDLGFRRFDIVVDGGISGDAGVEVAIVDAAAFEELTEVPDDAAWLTDAADGDDEDEDPDLAFGDWYDYDFTTHVLTPKDRVYLVRTSEGAVFKLQIADYYSEAGSSGFLKFYWAPLG